MDYAQLQELAAAGESVDLEFKASTSQLPRTGEALCAFLNTNGGCVLIGVSAKGEVRGQLVSDSTLQAVGELLKRFEPPAPVQIRRVPLPGSDHEVLVLEATRHAERAPFCFDGRPYERLGTTTVPMPQERYQQLLLERQMGQLRWENQATLPLRLEDLDFEEVRRTLRLGIAAGRLPELAATEPVEAVLDRLGLRSRGRLTHAAAVLFGRFEGETGLLADLPQCLLKLARFRGREKGDFLDQRQVQGHAFALLEEAMLFLRRHLPVAGRVQAGLFERVDEPLFPLAALREALVNAFCHRDYGLPGGAVSVAIFDDRLEIWSDGILPLGLTVRDLKQDHTSRPRNPLIAKVFYFRGLVERWGRGTQKIVELCVEAGHPEPEFVEKAGALGVRFLPSGYVAPHRVSQDLTERQRQLLHFLASTGGAPLRAIVAELPGLAAPRTLREDLALLKRVELIELVGSGRGSYYRLRRSPGSS